MAGKHRVPKTSQRIIAIGAIDELNAHIGLVISSLSQLTSLKGIKNSCLRIQNDLFNLGAQLAVLPEDKRNNTPTLLNKDIIQLENEMDKINKNLPTLTSFILPGGSEVSSKIHVARTVCRRAEINLLKLSEKEKIDDLTLPYINRLSDWLFVVARFSQIKQGENETLWQPNNSLT